MHRRNVLTMITCFLVLVSASSIVSHVAAGKTSNMDTPVDTINASVVIIDAYYTNEDGDVDDNDVIGIFNIVLNGAEMFVLDVHVTLTLPSGTSYTYSESSIVTEKTLHCTMYFLDYATEPGDYTISVDVLVNNCGTCSASEELVFDPPGGSGDTDPVSYMIF